MNLRRTWKSNGRGMLERGVLNFFFDNEKSMQNALCMSHAFLRLQAGVTYTVRLIRNAYPSLRPLPSPLGCCSWPSIALDLHVSLIPADYIPHQFHLEE